MTRPRAPAPAWAIAVLLAVACLGFTARAWLHDPTPPPRPLRMGHLGDVLGVTAREVLARLGASLLRCQEADGGFRADADPKSRHADDAERVAATALAAAALAQMRDLRVTFEGRDDGLTRARAYLRTHQTPRGPVVGTPPGTVRLQVEATAAAAWAWLYVGASEDAAPLREAGAALRRMGRDGFDNGYPRALVAMFAERVARLGLVDRVLEGQARDLVRWREQKVLPTEGGFELWDSSLAEAISRIVLGQMTRRQGAVDPFPLRVERAIVATPPVWRGAASDVQAWWMQAWIAARGGDAGAWFEALLEILDEWADEETGLLPGSFYAPAVVQTAAGSLALCEGLMTEPPLE